jgi:hypothetical protein
MNDRVVLGNGSLLLLGFDDRMPPPARGVAVDHSTHRLLATIASPDGTRFGTWQLSSVPANSRCRTCETRTISAGRTPGEFWTIRAGGYEIEKWSATDGEKLIKRYRVQNAP